MCAIAWHDIVAKPTHQMSVYTIIWNDFVVRPHQCVWCCGPTLTAAPLTPDHTSPLPSLASLVTNECLYKAAASSTICRLPPNSTMWWNSTAHLLSLYMAVLQHQNLPQHNVCASHSPWRGDFWGGTHRRSGTKHLCAARFKKKGWFKNYFLRVKANLPIWHQGAKAFVVQMTAATCSYL